MTSPIQTDNVALITGASSGLGRQLALDLAEKGMRLALADFEEKGIAELARLLEEKGAHALPVPVDVTDLQQCQFMARKAIETFGQLDLLGLCAGISMWARFEEITDVSLFRRLIEVNFLGVVNCVHVALPSLCLRQGTLVTISSLQGVLGIPNHTAYAASKHAVNGFLDSLEFEMGDRIRILNVMPGWITGTNLRAHSFNADGSRGGAARKHSRESVTVEECSRLVLSAVARGQRTLFIPRKLRYLPWLRTFAPGLLKRLIAKAVGEQHP